MVPQAEQFQKLQSSKKEEMLDVIRTYNNSNYKIMNLLNMQVVPDKVFFMFVSMLLHFFVDSGNLLHFERPKKEREF